MSTSGTSAAAFTGTSAFSSDLSAVVSRAISFASLPLQQLQNQQTSLQSQQTELTSVTSDFQSLQAALDSINNSAGAAAYSAAVDDPSVATASISAGVLAGSYSLNVINTGSLTNTLSSDSLATVTNPATTNIDSATAYSLTVDNQTYSISDSNGSLSGLAQAINASGANVQATIVNVGSSASPDYRLAVQGSQYGPSTIQLNDGHQDLLNTISTGKYVQYQVSGASSIVSASSRTVNLSTGLSVNLLQTGSVNIAVSQSTSGIESALTSFASAYNNAADEIAKSRGQNGGALTGQSIVYDLSSVLQNLANFSSSSGGLSSLADIGLSFDSSGHLEFDASTFNQASSRSISEVVNFFGTNSSGGFLQTANNILNSVTDLTTGTLTEYSQSVSTELTDLSTKISSEQDQLNTLQTNLTNQSAKADATISNLEQQLSYITSLFSATQTQENAINNG